MKPYGIPRDPELEYPDVGTIQAYGFKSSCGRLPGKSGDYRPYICGAHKARTRRIWKRKARAEGRTLIQEGLNEWKLHQPEQPSELPSKVGSSCGAALNMENLQNQEKGEHMFFPHCHHFALFADPCALVDSMQLISAYAVERELQESRKKELEKAEKEKTGTSEPHPY